MSKSKSYVNILRKWKGQWWKYKMLEVKKSQFKQMSVL